MLISEGLIIPAPKVADEFILSFALKRDFCFIISNDKFRNYFNQIPGRKWLEDRRVPFMIIEEEISLCPNVDYSIIDLLPLDFKEDKKKNQENENTTLDVLNKIEKTEGELNII